LNRGVIYAMSAYIFWGLHPIYWKMLKHIPSSGIVSHRIIWSLVFFSIIITSRKNWGSLFNTIKNSKNKVLLFLPALLIGSNWATYIWAVNAGFVIETSLGYFISPLISVLLGVIFLKESLRRLQWFAMIIALSGVILMTAVYGQFPWISLFLATTWGLYGLLRKQSQVGPVDGLTIETLTLSVPAMIYLLMLPASSPAIAIPDLKTLFLLMGTGIVSGLPLIIYIKGARMIKLSLLGILQYSYPSLILILGYFVYGETMDQAKVLGFAFIWIAIIIYLIDVNRTISKRKI